MDETTGWNVDEVKEFWNHVLHESDIEAWLYVRCDRLKDDDTCWNDDGVTSIGKDEMMAIREAMLQVV